MLVIIHFTCELLWWSFYFDKKKDNLWEIVVVKWNLYESLLSDSASSSNVASSLGLFVNCFSSHSTASSNKGWSRSISLSTCGISLSTWGISLSTGGISLSTAGVSLTINWTGSVGLSISWSGDILSGSLSESSLNESSFDYWTLNNWGWDWGISSLVNSFGSDSALGWNIGGISGVSSFNVTAFDVLALTSNVVVSLWVVDDLGFDW